MTHTAFLQALAGFTFFPDDLLTYARQVSERLGEDGAKKRAQLSEKLTAVYAELSSLDERQLQAQSQFMEESAKLKKTTLPALQKKLEAAEHARALTDIERKLAS